MVRGRAKARQKRLEDWLRYLPILDSMASGDWDDIATQLRAPGFDLQNFIRFLSENDCAHTLYSFARQCDATAVLPAQLILYLVGASRYGQGRRKDLLDALMEVASAARNNDIPVVLIKGFHFSQRLYGAIETRWTRDLDLLIAERSIPAMNALLQHLGYAPESPAVVPDSTGRRLNHAVTWVRGEISVDLHHGLRVRPGYRVDTAELIRDSVPISIAGIPLAGLNDGHLVLLVLLGLASDIEQGRVSAKQLVDISMAMSELDGRLDWDTWLMERDREGLAEMLCAAVAVTRAAMSKSVQLPGLESAIRRKDSDLLSATAIAHDEALVLLAAPPHSLANRRWFLSHYEGGKLGYLGWWLLGGLFRPGSVGALLSHFRHR